jgi:hypothetical protein
MYSSWIFWPDFPAGFSGNRPDRGDPPGEIAADGAETKLMKQTSD